MAKDEKLINEELREAIISLEAARKHESRMRHFAEGLLEGVNVLNEARSRKEVFSLLIDIINGLLPFEHAFIAMENDNSGVTVMSSTYSGLNNRVWGVGEAMARVLDGNTLASFNVKSIPEWQTSPLSDLDFVSSAIHVPVRSIRQRGLLVCMHSVCGFFDKEQITILEDFAPLVSQALINLEHLEGLEATVSDRTKELSTAVRRLEAEAKIRIRTESELKIHNLQMKETQKELTTSRAELAKQRDHLEATVEQRTEELKTQSFQLAEALAKEKILSKLQREFVSMASHEFRTPLAIIDATAQRMKSQASKNQLTPEDAFQRIEKIRDAVRRMTRLMESTLTGARMQEGKIEINIEPCDIGKVVQEVCARQQEVAHSHNITCELVDLPDTIQADLGSLDQIFTNLLSNAVKYAPDAPDIHVQVRLDGHQVAVSVRDHGLGIDEEDLNKIGERFFRASNSTGIAGTGIGLNLVKTLVEMHSGSIFIQSKPGEGSTFTVCLPIAGPSKAEQAA